MKKMINNRPTHYMEVKVYIANYLSGFKRGRNTMDPPLNLEHEIKKAQINEEKVLAIYFNIDKVCAMMRRESLLIKISKAGIKVKMYNWIKDFINNRSIQITTILQNYNTDTVA